MRGTIYKQISCFVFQVGDVLIYSTLFSRRAGTFTCRQAKEQQAITSELLSLLYDCLQQHDTVRDNYPDTHAGRRKAVIVMGDLHLGHLKTGLGRGLSISIITRKTSWTSDRSFFALPCKKP